MKEDNIDIVQHLCDEKIEVRICILQSSTSIVNMECAGLLVGSTAEEVTAHIELTWDRGKESGFLCSYIRILMFILPLTLMRRTQRC